MSTFPRLLSFLCCASLAVSWAAHAADRPAGALPPSKVRERFRRFQAPAVKEAIEKARAAREQAMAAGAKTITASRFDRYLDDERVQRQANEAHDRILIDAANAGLRDNSLSLRALTTLAQATRLNSSQDQIALEIARTKGPVLSYKEQKLLLDKGVSMLVRPAKQVVDTLIEQHKTDLTPRQQARLRKYAEAGSLLWH